MATDAALIQRIVEETNAYLDNQRLAETLWCQIDGHLSVSRLAESLGDVDIARRHLGAVTRLFAEVQAISTCAA